MRWGLGMALLATVAAALWPVEEPGITPTPTPTPARAVPSPSLTLAMGSKAPPPRDAAPARATPSGQLPDRNEWADVKVWRDPFNAQALGGNEPPAVKPTVRPAAPAASAPTPEPAPTLPWTYAGRLRVPGQPDAVLLHDGPRTVPVASGQTLGDWRLEADRGEHIDFTHLPTGVAVVLATTP
jgi:hypothetical protein